MRNRSYWGKKSGGFYNSVVLKGTSGPQGFMVKIKRGGQSTNNSVPKVRSPSSLLVAAAKAKGWYNGVKIR